MERKLLPEDPQFSKQCSFNDHGYRCQSNGHLSTGTQGAGPWYCRLHFSKIMGWPVWTAQQREETQAEIDDRVDKRFVPRRDMETDQEWTHRCRRWTLEKLGLLKFDRMAEHPLPQSEPGELG